MVEAVDSVAAARRGGGEMELIRSLRHLAFAPWQLRAAFDAKTLAAIEQAIAACERLHPGEIRFAVEAALSPSALWRGQTPRERAEQVFAELRVWDTEHNNGVLIYVLLADRDVEIVADRGVGNARVPATEWRACCEVIETHYRAGDFLAGSVAGIGAVAAVLARYPPTRADAGNELPDAPVLL